MAWDKGDWLNLAGAFARDDQLNKAEKIKERGEQLAELNKLYMAIATQKYATDEAIYKKNEEAWLARDVKLKAIGPSSSKTNIAEQLASIDGKTWTNEEQKEAIISTYMNNIIPINYTDEDDIPEGKKVGDVKQWKLSSNYNPSPIAPQWGKEYYDMDMYPKKIDELKDSTRGKWTTFLRGKNWDSGDEVLANLQTNLEEGSKRSNKEFSDYYNAGQEYAWDATDDDSSTSLRSVELGTEGIVSSYWDGELIDLNNPLQFLDMDKNEVQEENWKIINDRFIQSTDENSGAFADNTQKALLSSLTVNDVEVLGKWDTATGKIDGLKPEAAFLVSRADSIQNDVAIALYHRAGWITGNTITNSSGKLKDRFNFEIARRAIEVDTKDKWDGIADIFFLGGDPIAGTYLIPTKVLPLWKDLPEEVKHLDTGELTNTQEYLQTVLTDIVKANGEGKTTMGALTHIIDAEVFKILNQDATQEEINNVIRSTVVVDDDGQGFTELGVHRTFEELKNMIEATEGKFKDVTIDSLSDDLKEKYKEWELTQNSDEEIVEEESQDVSKMNLSEATEKNLITADYLNNLSYEAPGGAQQEMFRTGGNNMMSVGDIITTKDGKKYESYHDTVKNEYGRDVTTIRFRPITEVKVPTTDEEFVGGIQDAINNTQ